MAGTRRIAFLFMIVALLGIAGCPAGKTDPPPTASLAATGRGSTTGNGAASPSAASAMNGSGGSTSSAPPATSTVEFDCPKGFSLRYPANWQAYQDDAPKHPSAAGGGSNAGGTNAGGSNVGGSGLSTFGLGSSTPGAPASSTASGSSRASGASNAAGGASGTSDPGEVLSLRLPADSAGRVPKITVLVPVLPPHIPGFIPVLMVESGFVDDLRKRFRTVHETQSVDVQIPGTSGCRQATVNVANPLDPGEDTASVIQVLLAVHGDGVYIFDAETSDAAAPGAKAALKTMSDSLKWTK